MKRKYVYRVWGEGKLIGVKGGPKVRREIQEIYAPSRSAAVTRFRRLTQMHTITDRATGGWKDIHVECLGELKRGAA